MKVMLFVYSMQCGGAERAAATLANDWAALGWRVDLVTQTPASNDFYSLHPRVRRIALDLAHASKGPFAGIWANLRRLLALRRLMAQRQPDIVLGIMTTASVLAILAACGTGIRVIASEHTHPPQLPLTRSWRQLRRWALPMADSVVALTSDSKAWLETHCGCRHVWVIPPPFVWPIPRQEPVVWPEQTVAPDRRLLLSVGRLSAEKGFDELIDAFAQAAPEHWDLAIVGEGAQRTALEARIECLGLGRRVHLVGRVGNVADWYARADLYALSSRYEGLPMTLVEAMASGCPAVSYDCDTGPRDIIRHGYNGLLAGAPGNTYMLASALRSMMSSDSARKVMAARAPDVRVTFSSRRTTAMWQRLLAGQRNPECISGRVGRT
jgi:glycosyltransferase involved in cell wall biosynthesis